MYKVCESSTSFLQGCGAILKVCLCVCGGEGGVTSDSKLGGVGGGENTFFSVSLYGFQKVGGLKPPSPSPSVDALVKIPN